MIVALLEQVFEYQILLYKKENGKVPLTKELEHRLKALTKLFEESDRESLFEGKAKADYKRKTSRIDVEGPVEFKGQGKFTQGIVVSLSGGGLFIQTKETVPIGSNIVIRFYDREKKQKYYFPGVVVRVKTGKGGGMGIQFKGIPLLIPDKEKA